MQARTVFERSGLIFALSNIFDFRKCSLLHVFSLPVYGGFTKELFTVNLID